MFVVRCLDKYFKVRSQSDIFKTNKMGKAPRNSEKNFPGKSLCAGQNFDGGELKAFGV